jgi:hypothetical protein
LQREMERRLDFQYSKRRMESAKNIDKNSVESTNKIFGLGWVWG